MLALQDPFTISATVAFDVYMADFQMSLQELTSDTYDFEQSDSEQARRGNGNFDLVARSTTLIDMTSNDDETFKRVIPKQKIYPHTLDEDNYEA